MKDAYHGFISSVIVVREDVMKARKKEVIALINFFYRQAEWIEENVPTVEEMIDVSWLEVI